MKKLLLMLLCMPATLAMAYDLEVNGVYYNITSLNPRTCEVTKGPGDIAAYAGAITIPGEISTDASRTYTVTAIGDSAFAGCTELLAVTLPSQVDTIGQKAFDGCQKLQALWCTAKPALVDSLALEGVNKSVKVYFPLEALEAYQSAQYWNELTLIGCATIAYTTTDNTTVNAYKEPAFVDANGQSLNIIEGTSGTWVVDGVVAALTDSAFYGCSTLASIALDENTVNWGADALTGTAWWEAQPKGMYYQGTTAYKYKDTGATIVKIKEGTTAINGNAMSDSCAAQIIFLPASLKKIGNNAFAGCSNLQTLYCEATPAQVEAQTFAGLDQSTSKVLVPVGSLEAYKAAPYWSELTNLGEYELKEVAYTTTNGSVLMPYASPAFYDAQGQGVNIIENTYDAAGGTMLLDAVPVALADSAFWSCSTLAGITLDNEMSWGKEAWTGTAWWEAQPSGMYYHGTIAYKYKETGATILKIQDGTTSINANALSDRNALESIFLPASLKEIGSNALIGCQSLKTLYADAVPAKADSLTFAGIDKEALEVKVPMGSLEAYKAAPYWNELANITEVQLTPVAYVSTDKAVVNPYTTPAFYAAGGESLNVVMNTYDPTTNEGVMILDGVPASLADSAFLGCSTLKEMAVIEKMADWGVDAMSGTAWWKAQPNGMYYKGTTAYKYKNAGATLKIKEGTTTIVDNAMRDDNTLQTIVMPASVEEIGSYAFAGCGSLKTIYCDSVPAKADSLAFAGLNTETSKIMVPSGCLEAYQSAPVWSELTNITEYKTTTINYTTIDSRVANLYKVDAFVDSLGNTLVVLGNTYADNVGTITISGEVKGIADSAFVACENLKTIAIQGTVQIIGKYAFANCSNMTHATLYSGIKEIRNNAFENCLALTGIDLPSSIEKIGDKAFYNCKKATWLFLPTNEAVLGDNVFLGCNQMLTITVSANPGSITTKTFQSSTFTKAILTVPYGCYAKFKADKLWGKFAKTYEGGTVEIDAISALEDVNLSADEQVTLTAVAMPDETSEATLFWSSSNSNVATVDANGVVTAISAGEAIITASTLTFNQKSTSCVVTVNAIQATSISLNEAEVNMNYGEKLQLVAMVLPETTSDKSILWVSSDDEVATVDEQGLVTATGVGDAVITALTTDGSKLKATCLITVNPVQATLVSLNKVECTLEQGDSLQLVATVAPQNTTNKEVRWTSSDESIATVDENGLVTTHAGGIVYITAYTTDGSEKRARCYIEVIAVESISSVTADQKEETYYDLSGKATIKQQSGIKIVRKADGRVQKILVK